MSFQLDAAPLSENDIDVVQDDVEDSREEVEEDKEDMEDVEDDDPKDPTRRDAPRKTKGRPPLFCKDPKWHDLPEWWSRKDCPLLQLPDHILNQCFALHTGLALRDYVALASVSKFFRTQMDDSVFREICIARGLSSESLPSGALMSSMIVSRNLAPWYQPPKRTRLSATKGDHYHPRGDRADWSKEQYKVYREERDIFLATERLERYRHGLDAAQRRQQSAGEVETHPPVRDGRVVRHVIGVVKGRRHGEPPAQVGHKGGTPKDYIARIDADKLATIGRRTWNREGEAELIENLAELKERATKPPPPPYDMGDSGMSSDSSGGSESDREQKTDVDTGGSSSGTTGKRKRSNRRRRRCKGSAEAPARGRKKRRKWVVPSTPCDSESDEYEWDGDTGNKVIHDYWPSPWRIKASESLKDARVNKKTAKEKWKLSDAELLRLQHVLVHNPMNSRAPKQLFLVSAVEALAFRSHGGPIGHRDWVAKMSARSVKNLATRQSNIQRAKEAGTYQSKMKKNTTPVHWTGGTSWAA